MKKSYSLVKAPSSAVVLVTTATVVVGLILFGCAASSEPLPGAAGIGDPYYETLGNGGYDVDSYTISLDVEPVANIISGTTVIVAHATQPLSSFNLDFEGLEIGGVTVDGLQADFGRDGRELTITPADPLRPNTSFSVAVTYHGSPQPAPSVAAKYAGDTAGWFHAADGSISVLSPPNGAATWFPANDHPRDKASYRFEIVVPRQFVVAASGTWIETIEQGDKTRHVWEMNQPMASYLAAISIGNYLLETGPDTEGVAIRSYYPPGFDESRRRGYVHIPEMIAEFTDLFGPYPFPAYGVLVAGGDIAWCDEYLVRAFECQTLSIHCPGFLSGHETQVAHELAHQWFGNSVSLNNWRDLWLKEGLATYAGWLWLNREGGVDAVSAMVERQQFSRSHEIRIGEPPADELYHEEVYIGGALLFHALRLRVGDEAFFNILRAYASRFQYRNAGTEDFVRLAEEVSGEDLQPFFDAWLYGDDLPDEK